MGVPNDAEGIREIVGLTRKADDIRISYVEDPRAGEGMTAPVIVRTRSGQSEVQSIKGVLDEWRGAPDRRTGTAKASTLEAFIALTNRHKDEHSAIFGCTEPPSLQAVIDYHTTDLKPRFCRHRVVFDFPLSPEWMAWRGEDGEKMTGTDFALFIEEHVADLASPTDGERNIYERLFATKFATPAEMIQLSRGISVRVETDVKEARTIQSGEAEITFVEAHKDGSGNKLVVPGLFVVAIPLFNGGETQRLIARLRYRVVNGRVVWVYHLYRPDLVVQETVRAAMARAAADTSLPAYEASPEA